MKKETLRRILLCLIGVWGFASIIICAVEDIPGQPMSDEMFYGSKFIGILSFLLCCLTGRWLDRKGMLTKTRKEEES